ncbi:MAG: hypothetical protein V3W31_01260, partial [Thermodesulfobacteriota bacterium]
VRAAPGISLTYMRELPAQLGFTVNGGGLSTVTRRDGDLSFLRHLPSSVAYRLRENPEVFVVEPGGGMELLSAVENGAAGVRGAEISTVVADAMEGPLSEFSGSIYGDARVSRGHGRNVLAALDGKFDIIKLPRTDTLGSASSGIRGLQEDYGLTAEAFGDYLGRLKEGGYVSVSLFLLPPPRQELKLLSTAIEGLRLRGVADAAARIMAIRSWGVITLLVKNGTVEPWEVEVVKEFCSIEGFDVVWYPGMEEREANLHNRFPSPVYHDHFREILDPRTREPFLEGYIFDVRPATDERPFFGQSFKMGRMKETYESVGKKWGILIEGGYLLPWILIQAVLASFIFIVAPFFFTRRERVPPGVLLRVSAYFASIGVGYMFVEISLMHKLVPVLGEPVYAISVVLFSLLVSSGAGSYLSGRFGIMERSSANVLLAVPLLVLVYLYATGPVSGAVAALPVAWKYPLTALFFFPLGAAMGMPFPAGMALLGRTNPGLIPWAWCVNGSFSVISSVLVMMGAMVWGFSAVLGVAALAYAAAWLAIRALSAEG